MPTLLRVLVVEDSEDDVDLLLQALQESGYAATLVRVETAQEMALALARLPPAIERELREASERRSRREAELALQKNEARLERQIRRLQALNTIDIAITESLDLQTTLEVLLDQVIAELAVDAAAVLRMKPQLQVLEYAASRGLGVERTLPASVPLGAGLAGRAAQERRSIYVGDPTECAEPLPHLPLMESGQIHAYCALPLVARGEVRGVLELFHRVPPDPDPDWFEFLEALCGQAAIAIDNAELLADLQRSNEQLTMAYETTLEGWSRALDLRDRETEGHCLRVSEMAVALGRAMGVSEEELVHLRRGALLHDIGKMGIPDRILHKPALLTEEQTEIMQQHPVYAYELLSPIEFLRPALDIPYCHHEKWDGTGYPRGLKGEQIPLAARIFAVVDVWDALRSDRPYRVAWPEDRVREYIQSLVGIHFDPKVVTALFETRVIESWREIAARHSGGRATHGSPSA